MFVSPAPAATRSSVRESLLVSQSARESLWRQPVAFALVFFALLTTGLGLWAWRACDGIWTYAFDDAYIHLTISHNLAFAGVWGVSSTSFSSASSSPLWTVLLAGVLRVWNSDLAPLLLNAAWGVGVLLVTARLWKNWEGRAFSRPAQTLGLLALCLVAPLSMLAFIGMEHTMHACLALVFLGVASQAIGERKSARSLPLWACLMSGARFEGVFLAGFAALALARQKRFGAAAATLGASLVPFVLHGLMARAQGWPFVAASVAIKSVHPQHSLAGAGEFAGSVLLKWLLAWGCTAMALLALGLARKKELPSSLQAALGLFGAAVLCHVALAAVSTFFRYEAYLFILGIATLWPAVIMALPRERVWKAMPLQLGAIFVALAWTGRAFVALRDAAPATRNIYRQQRQMARFISEFYPRETVALNDIGTTAWSAANRPGGHAALDLVGLSDREIMRSRLSDPHLVLWPRVAQRVVSERKVHLAIIYDEWFEPHLFGPGWTRVARWDTGPKVVSAGRRVAFWTTKANAPRLRSQLKAFQGQLPQGVSVLWN